MQMEWVGSKRGRSAHIALESIVNPPEALCGSRGTWDHEWDHLPEGWRACERCTTNAFVLGHNLVKASQEGLK